MNNLQKITNDLKIKYYNSKGYTYNDEKKLFLKGKRKAPPIEKNNEFSTLFKKFWRDEFKAGNVALFYDNEKIFNPETNRFIQKTSFNTQKGKIKFKDTEVYNGKIVNPDVFIQEKLIPKIQTSIDTGKDTSIIIPKGTIGNIKNLLEVLPFGSKKLYFKLGNGSFYFLNTENVKRLSEIETNLWSNLTIKDVTTRKSDDEYQEEIVHNTKPLELFIESFKGVKVPGAEFFPYTHNLDMVDLTRQHIYHQLTDEVADTLHENNCLLHALKVAGCDINPLKIMCKNQNIPLRQLKNIAEIMKIYITVRRIEDNKNLRKFGNSNHKRVELGIIENHYFLIETLPYTGYSIRNYFDVVGKKDWNCIIKKNFQKDSKRFLTSYDIIKILVELKVTHLKKCNITNAIFKTKHYEKMNVYDNLEFITGLKEDYKPQYEYETDENGEVEITEKLAPTPNVKLNTLRELPSQRKVLDKKTREPTDENYFKIKGVEFFDFETTTKRNDNKPTEHKAYHINHAINNITQFNEGWTGDDCAKQYLDYLVERYGELYNDEDLRTKVYQKRITVKLIAHNCGYDFRFIQEYLHNIETLEKGASTLFTATGIYYSSTGYGKYVKNEKGMNVWLQPPEKKLINIEFVDSLKMINMPLKNFNKCFQLGDVKKEIMPYDLYTEENVKKRYLKHSYVDDWINEKSGYSKQDIKIFWTNMVEWKCIGKKKNPETEIDERVVDIVKYSIKYCYMDCITLREGYQKFRQMAKDACSLDIYNFVSLASLADFYLKREGCYTGVYQISGVLRSFIQECVVGGRTMCRKNQKFISLDDNEEFKKMKNSKELSPQQKVGVFNQKLADFDGVSLYPSAMFRMEGFLQGIPKIIQTFEPEKYDGYFIKIKILGIKKHYDFPLVSFKDENGIRQFTNDVIGKSIFVDKTYLEDLIKFHGLTYEFIQGYYYNEGRNALINDVILHLFNTRIKYKSIIYVYKNDDEKQKKIIAEYKNKKEYKDSIHKTFTNIKIGNPIQMVFKELMNSSYGKSYLKPIDTKTDYIKEKEKNEFIDRNYNYIKEFTELPNGQYKVKTIKTINDHFNNAHVGVEILSMSKRIMNEVMTTAEDLKIDMFITDTDSIHIDSTKIKILADKFKEIYCRDLIGTNLGQFHTDFDVDGADNDNIVATKSIVLGKKCYYDFLQCINTDGKIVNGEHIRMKGIPNSVILHRAKSGLYEQNIIVVDENNNIINTYDNINEWKKSVNYKIEKRCDFFKKDGKLIKDFHNSVYELYLYLYQGNEVSFDLLSTAPKFEFHKNMTISSKTEFNRRISFPDKPICGFEEFTDKPICSFEKGQKVKFKPIVNKISYRSDYLKHTGILELDEYEGIINRIWNNSYSITYKSPNSFFMNTAYTKGNQKELLKNENINVLKENVWIE